MIGGNGTPLPGLDSVGGADRAGKADDTYPARLLDWEDDSWRDQAACRSTAADLFFPIGRTRVAIEQIQAAKAVCLPCEVRDTCLLYALETNQDAGIWGGTSEDERRKLRRVWLARRRGPLAANRTWPSKPQSTAERSPLVTRSDLYDQRLGDQRVDLVLNARAHPPLEH